MVDEDFSFLDDFIRKNRSKFKNYEAITTKRKFGIIDMLLKKLYFVLRENGM